MVFCVTKPLPYANCSSSLEFNAAGFLITTKDKPLTSHPTSAHPQHAACRVASTSSASARDHWHPRPLQTTRTPRPCLSLNIECRWTRILWIMNMTKVAHEYKPPVATRTVWHARHNQVIFGSFTIIDFTFSVVLNHCVGRRSPVSAIFNHSLPWIPFGISP